MERILKIKIKDEFNGYTVGTVIRNSFGISSHLLSDLKKSGGILLDSKSTTVRHTVNAGSTLELVIRDESSSETIEPSAIPIEVIYEDEDILAVNKPKDMPVHPSINNHGNTLANAVMNYYSGREFVFRPITRLDRDTTGVVIIAKNKFSAQALSDSMKDGRFTKKYVAILSNTPKELCGTVCAPIARAEDSVIKRCVSGSGKEARTEYKIIKQLCDGECVGLLSPITGRTHQIRVHMEHIGCPLKYDYLYGKEIEGKTLYLHCASVTFPHPCGGEPITVSCLPHEFDGVDMAEMADKIFVDKTSSV